MSSTIPVGPGGAIMVIRHAMSESVNEHSPLHKSTHLAKQSHLISIYPAVGIREQATIFSFTVRSRHLHKTQL